MANACNLKIDNGLFRVAGALVLQRVAGRQSAVCELRGRAVPGASASAATASPRQRSALLSCPVRRGAQRTPAFLGAAEARGAWKRIRATTSRSHALRIGQYFIFICCSFEVSVELIFTKELKHFLSG